jgi:hypothetical protein
VLQLTLRYWRRTAGQNVVAAVGGRRLQDKVGDGGNRPLLLLEGRGEEEVGDAGIKVLLEGEVEEDAATVAAASDRRRAAGGSGCGRSRRGRGGGRKRMRAATACSPEMRLGHGRGCGHAGEFDWGFGAC